MPNEYLPISFSIKILYVPFVSTKILNSAVTNIWLLPLSNTTTGLNLAWLLGIKLISKSLLVINSLLGSIMFAPLVSVIVTVGKIV